MWLGIESLGRVDEFGELKKCDWCFVASHAGR